MLQHANPPLADFQLRYQRIHCCFWCYNGHFGGKSFIFLFLFFPLSSSVMAGLRRGRSLVMRVSCAPTAGTIIFFPHLVPGDSGRCIFSRCAWQGGPHWLNYPAVLVTPTPLFTQMKPQRIERSDERGNGVGPSCLFLDLVCSFIAILFAFRFFLSNPNPVRTPLEPPSTTAMVHDST